MTAGQTHSHELKRDAIGAPGIVFFVVAAAAPLAATLGASPMVFGATGPGGPGAYLSATVVLLLFAVGYATMSRHVTSAGGFAAYISRGLGGAAGFAAAFVALLAYNCMLAGIFGQFGAFAADILDRQVGIDLPWQAWVAIGLAGVALLGYRDVQLSARVLGILLVAEMLILLVLDLVVVADGGASGLSATAFAPGEVFSGAVGVAIVFAFSCFVGFEATTIYGEEARNPRRTVPRATYAAILVIGLFYTLTTWSIGIGYGSSAVAGAAQENPVGFVTDLSTRFVGAFSTDLMNLLVLTSLFAVVLAFHNTLARYLFSLGRAGVLPAALGRTRATDRAPHVASVVQSCVTTLVVGVFAISGADPFANLFAWLVGLGTLGVLVLQATASIAVMAFFARTRADTRLWHTRIAPLLGLAGLATAIVLVLGNFDVLTGATSGLVPLLPWLVPVAALAGVATWYATRGRGVELIGAADIEPADQPSPAATPVAGAGPA
jgi:amino acid transporter